MKIIKGTVIHGDKIGKKQGYPTANLSRRVLIYKKLNKGVYVATVELKKRTYKALLVIGIPGIKKQKKGKVEVYLLNYQGNLYNKKLVVRVYKKLRGIKYYKHKVALKKQIYKDIQAAKKYFS